MNKSEYQQYLKSDHWINLKLKKSRKAKLCWCCRVKPHPGNFHHIRYKQIFDVTTNDIRLLCESCHHLYHAMKDERPHWPDEWIWKSVKRHNRQFNRAVLKEGRRFNKEFH